MDEVLIGTVLASTLRVSVPLILCALAGVLCERAGVIDLGLEGKLEQAPTSGAGIDAGGDGHGVRVVIDLHKMFVADIQTFEVLTHDHQVDLVESAARNDGQGRPKIRVEFEFLPQTHVR